VSKKQKEQQQQQQQQQQRRPKRNARRLGTRHAFLILLTRLFTGFLMYSQLKTKLLRQVLRSKSPR